MSPVVETILTLHGAPAYAVVGGLAFAEAALFVGFVLPGETAVVLSGVAAHEHRVSLPTIATVAVLAAIIGDSVGYEVGTLAPGCSPAGCSPAAAPIWRKASRTDHAGPSVVQPRFALRSSRP